ncbi:phosphatidate cytidylyltransferase [Rhabdochlamydiaceae symbiont of Dictyostelium giganteum]|uniref:phosphatidate cytidylyltransferase n=1 Tax=Rhabdochlamydiaceae symbiont of Dictyostelium giganteum TaxID=3342349 RepID=UPI003850523E
MLKSKSEFLNRLVFTGMAVAVMTFLFFFAYNPWIHALLVILTMVLSGIGVWEYGKLASAKGIPVDQRRMVIVTMLGTFALYAAFVYPHKAPLIFPLIILGLISLFIARFHACKNAILSVAAEFFGVCYLSFPLSMLLAILYAPSLGKGGRFWLIYLIAVTKVSDIGGYFVGKLWGKRPLALELSPKKTIEGAIGGFCFAVSLSVFFSVIGSQHGLSLAQSVWLGILIGILAQVGDLAESLLKRDAMVKDSNKIPGVGGVLDLVDSLLLTSPMVYFFIQF